MLNHFSSEFHFTRFFYYIFRRNWSQWDLRSCLKNWHSSLSWDCFWICIAILGSPWFHSQISYFCLLGVVVDCFWYSPIPTAAEAPISAATTTITRPSYFRNFESEILCSAFYTSFSPRSWFVTFAWIWSKKHFAISRWDKLSPIWFISIIFQNCCSWFPIHFTVYFDRGLESDSLMTCSSKDFILFSSHCWWDYFFFLRFQHCLLDPCFDEDLISSFSGRTDPFRWNSLNDFENSASAPECLSLRDCADIGIDSSPLDWFIDFDFSEMNL